MRVLLGVSAAFAVMTGSAHAAEVKVETVISCDGDVVCEKYNGGTPHSFFQFAAKPGEANDVSITVSGRTLAIHDAGAPLTAGSGCTASGANDATCNVGGPPYADFNIGLGDGADRLRVEGMLQANASIAGGPGDDDLTGGAEDDVLLGGIGSDRLAGAGGADMLRGGEVTPDGESIEPDALDGGLGDDLVSYAERKQAVTVDLGSAAATQGSQGEGDSLASVENVWSGSGDDTLSGSDADGSLRGGAGSDALDGRGGNDVLIGDGGTDTSNGGAGVDRIDSNDGRAEQVSCGTDIDIVAGERFDDIYGIDRSWIGADAGDVLARDCEGVALNGDARKTPFTVDPRARHRGTIVTLVNPCRQPRAGRRCRGQL